MEIGGCYQFVFLCSHGCDQTHKHTHQLGEGGRAGLRSMGAEPRRRKPKRWGETHTLSPAPFFRILGLQLGLEGRGPSWVTSGRHLHSLTEGRKGAVGAASMLYCFPPGTLFLLERPKWYSGGEKGPEGTFRMVHPPPLSAQVSPAVCPSIFTHLPRPLSSSLTYPPESSRKSSGG